MSLMAHFAAVSQPKPEPRHVPEIEKIVHETRQWAGAGGQCGFVAEQLQKKYGWPAYGGYYHAHDGRVIGDHVWNVHEPSGTIIDSTADQHGEGPETVKFLSPDHPDYGRYQWAESEDDDERRFDESGANRREHGPYWWTGGPNEHADAYAAKVRQHYDPGHSHLGMKTAAALPPPYPNPETGYRHWFHGTASDYDNDTRLAEDHVPEEERRPGGTVKTQPVFNDEYGMNAEKHWNTDLGTHFASEHDMASKFADHGKYPNSRIAHVALHMANPKHYASEFDMTHDAIQWAHANGHHYYPPEIHDEVYHHLNEGGEPSEVEDSDHLQYLDDAGTETHLKRLGIDGGIASWDRGQPGHPMNAGTATLKSDGFAGIHPHGKDLDDYLQRHPDREEITAGFKKHLEDLGHDGVTYGNEYESPQGSTCAIAFHDHQMNMHRWEWLGDHKRDDLDEHDDPKRVRRDPDQERLFDATYSPEKGYHWDSMGGSLGPMQKPKTASADPIWKQPKPEWDAEEYYKVQREHGDEGAFAWSDARRGEKNHWQSQVRKAMSRGDLSPEDAWQQGYRGIGHDEDHRKSFYDANGNLAWQPLPKTLYHVTTHRDAVLADGLKSRDELGQRGGNGLGGGEDDTISFTDDPEIAHHIHRALHEYHAVLTGKKTIGDLVDEAHRDGYLRHVLDLEHGNGSGEHFEKTGELPPRLRAHLVGRTIENAYGMSPKTAEQAKTEIHPDARPEDDGWVGGDGQRYHNSFSRPATDEETLRFRSSHYKAHAGMRAHFGPDKVMDPGFIMNDPKGMASSDPSQFAVLKVHPKPGAMGYPVSALGEWRTADGSAVDVEPHHGKTAAKVPIKAYHATFTANEWPPKGWVHVGTMQAALDRASNMDGDNPGHSGHYEPHHGPAEKAHWRVHEVEIHGRIYPHVLDDEHASSLGNDYGDNDSMDPAERRRWGMKTIHDLTPEHDEDLPEPVRGFDAIPYVNDNEDKGSISYLVHPKALKLVQTHDLGPTGWNATSHHAKLASTEGPKAWLPNPYHDQHDEWFHGTKGDYEGGPDPAHKRDTEEAERGDKDHVAASQFNQLLGTHFSSLHSVAHRFGGESHPSAHSRVFHARLDMPNPIHFPDESSILHHAWRWASSQHPTALHNEDHDSSMAWQYGHGSTMAGIDQRLAAYDKATREGSLTPAMAHRTHSSIASSIESHLQWHPQAYGIARAYVQHLADTGRTGITYGNVVEGPKHHICAIATEPDQIHLTSVDQMHPDIDPKRIPPSWPQETRDKAALRLPDEVSHSHIRTIHDEPEDMLEEVERYHNGGMLRSDPDFYRQAPWGNTGRGEYKYASREKGWTHYTDQEFEPGDEITSPASRGVTEHRWGQMQGYDPRNVYLAHPEHDPVTYSRFGPHAYLVEPEGEPERDPEFEYNKQTWRHELESGEWSEEAVPGHDSYVTPKARVIKRLSVAHVLDSWEPKERLFAPTKDGVDPRLFDADRKMLPWIRQEVLGEVADFYERHGYGSDAGWARVYLAGSQASEWYGNNDFDILVGINYPLFRASHPDLARLSDAEIGHRMNVGFANDFNDEQWHPRFDPEHEWHRTGYVNKDSWDIREIKPYAAYNVTDDVWAVDPIDEPTGHQFGPTEWYYFESMAEEVRQALALPEPQRSARAAQVWHFIHTDRSRAFGPHGSGLFDRGNALEKYLDQAESGIPGKSLMAALADAKFGVAS